MNLLENDALCCDKLIELYHERIERENRNVIRVRKFYHNDDDFNALMEKITQKDYDRFQKLLSEGKSTKNPWRILYVILEIVMEEGQDIPPFDTLTKMLPSRSILYRGWTFSWVHGEGTLISIYNPTNELVYRF